MFREIVDEIRLERIRQDEKWGEQNHPDLYWLGIMVEEVGEVAKALIEHRPQAMRKELIEVVAVIFQWLECIERRNGTDGSK